MSTTGEVIFEYKGQKGRAAHERKQLKPEAAKNEQLAILQRGILSQTKFTAGGVQPTRLQCIDATAESYSFVYASDKSVVECSVNLALTDEESSNVKHGTQGANVSGIVKMKSIASDNILPTPVHKYEIQSLIASVDARGATYVYKKTTANAASPQRKKQKQQHYTSHQVSDATTPEIGWAGIALDPTSASTTLATAHFFSKELRFYDYSTLQSTWIQLTVMYPTALSFSPTLASTAVVAEYNQFSVWDAKSKTRIVREGAPSQGCLYTIACSPDGNSIAMGGEDKVAYIYDTRMWKLRNRWRCPLKYDIAFLAFSPNDPKLCYVAGLDNELMCGRFDGSDKKKNKEAPAYSPSILQQNHRLGFRGDSRWIGLNIVSSKNQDMGFGICENGSAYAIRPAQYMLGN
ncbi:hypothetical protein THRCLA_00487 [Thraustotheca clavata]|uniref:Uncharacterized protein n=1 Tax=Thraustotheca clavata TaxID=74557 RepID=A0A1W0AB02_9STRA|nr:hypothetical protein THRCLA_00487 [Thraustotheca clavata]